MALLLDWFVQPLTLALLALLLSWIWLLRVPGSPILLKVFFASTIGLLWLSSAPLTANALVLKIESGGYSKADACTVEEARFAESDSTTDTMPVVVLGADLDAYAESENPYEVLSLESLTRTHYAATLDSGGNEFFVLGGGRTPRKLSDFMAQILIAEGVDDSRIVRESVSLSTKENAEQLALILPPDEARPITLVTSALHMRRATDIFTAAGFTSCPSPSHSLYSVSSGPVGLLPYITALNKTTRAWRELLATIKYHVV